MENHWNLFIIGDASQSKWGGDCCLADEDFSSAQAAKEWAEENWSIPMDKWQKDENDWEFEDNSRDVVASITAH